MILVLPGDYRSGGRYRIELRAAVDERLRIAVLHDDWLEMARAMIRTGEQFRTLGPADQIHVQRTFAFRPDASEILELLRRHVVRGASWVFLDPDFPDLEDLEQVAAWLDA